MSNTSGLRRSTRVSRLPTGRSLVAHPVAEAPYAPSVPTPASVDADATYVAICSKVKFISYTPLSYA
jgi:hypothetical protein